MAPDFRDHIAHTPKYTASADELAGLAKEARSAAATESNPVIGEHGFRVAANGATPAHSAGDLSAHSAPRQRLGGSPTSTYQSVLVPESCFAPWCGIDGKYANPGVCNAPGGHRYKAPASRTDEAQDDHEPNGAKGGIPSEAGKPAGPVSPKRFRQESIEIPVTVRVEMTPRLLAEAFSGMSDESQAQFFIDLAEIASAWDGDQHGQWYLVGRHLRTCECATDESRELIDTIARGVRNGT